MKRNAPKLKWDPLGYGPDIVYCDNPYCESPAFETITVSEERAGDSTRNFCAPCAGAYNVGVQHGTLTTLAELRLAKRRRLRGRAGGGKSSQAAAEKNIGKRHAPR